jgi:hypothetical protein
MPFPAMQGLFDGLFTPGLQCYRKGGFVDRLTDGAIAEHMKYG